MKLALAIAVATAAAVALGALGALLAIRALPDRALELFMPRVY